MREKKDFKLEDIKEIRLNWDCENVIFPRGVIRKFSYTYNEEQMNYFQDGYYLSEAYLEVDLDYVLNEFSYFETKKSEDTKNIDCLRYHFVWYIFITTNDNQEYALEVPFYCKGMYLDENTNIHNAKNSFENHQMTEESYIVSWNTDPRLTKLTFDEMVELFENKKKKGAPLTYHNFQIEVFSRLYKEKSEQDRIDFLGTFFRLEDGEICGNKGGVQIEAVSKQENDFFLDALSIRNDVREANICYFFINETGNSQNLFSFLDFLNQTEKCYEVILVLDDTMDFHDFHTSVVEYFKGKEIGNHLICVSLDKMNQVWFELICSWGV